jgi:hypothetical protein
MKSKERKSMISSKLKKIGFMVVPATQKHGSDHGRVDATIQIQNYGSPHTNVNEE